MATVRSLLRHRQPGFAAALESAELLGEREPHGQVSDLCAERSK